MRNLYGREAVVASAIIAVVVVGIGAVSFLARAGPPPGTGVLSGGVAVGPVFPVCRTNASPVAASEPWSSNRLIVMPGSGSPEYVRLNWTLSEGCEVSASFHVDLAAGTYRLDLDSCTAQSPRTFGCAKLPVTVTITTNDTTSINISVDTGIR